MASKPASTAVNELRVLLQEADQALNNAGEVADDKLHDIRDRLRSAIESAKPHLEEWRTRARDQVHHADEYVRTHPYHVIGIAAAVGAIAGVLLSRCRSSH